VREGQGGGWVQNKKLLTLKEGWWGFGGWEKEKREALTTTKSLTSWAEKWNRAGPPAVKGGPKEDEKGVSSGPN